MDDSNLETKQSQQNATVTDSDEQNLELESHSNFTHRSIQSLSQLQSRNESIASKCDSYRADLHQRS